MRVRFNRSLQIRRLLLVLLVLLGHMALVQTVALADEPTFSEIEQYVRARIDMGENMGNFFRNRKPPQFGPDGGPSMDELRKLETEINDFIANILSKHDLTIERYQSRSPDVFADTAGVNKFLEAHPDLKKRYEVLPQSPRGRRSH